MTASQPIRILRIIARLNIGGPAIQAISLSDHLSRDSYRTLLISGKVDPHEGDMAYFAEEKGVQPVILPKMGRDITLLGDMKSLIELRKIIKQFKPHIIHTHTAKAGTLGRLAGISFNLIRRSNVKIRLVHTFHGHIFHSYFGSLRTRLFIQIERFLSRFTDRIIVISPLQQHDMCWRYRIAPTEKVRIIPLGFDLSDFEGRENHRKQIRERYMLQDDQRVSLVGIIGRLTDVKNHRVLLEAAKCLKAMGKSERFKFLVVGDGELRQDLITYARELGIQNSVIFAGWQKDMPSIYEALDIVALTSLNEGTPVSLIEAMASARPVVATNVGGVRDLMGFIDEESKDGYTLAQHGILVPSGDGEVVARALSFLDENRKASKEMAERGREFVLNHYSVERLVKDIKSLYKEILSS
ncbi:MAG: glycosyltransferase family 4 protein [Desulfobacteraceae bacterium]|jgi:glycosyltransferase involved in cell wall biosynthesis